VRLHPNQSSQYPGAAQDLLAQNGQMAALTRNKAARVLWRSLAFARQYSNSPPSLQFRNRHQTFEQSEPVFLAS
ncbi:hypothetical protein, partial [Comamonas testosteroni]|uniref:hypothetical protein n=1 Tax=Comamonas testosteroni TaxID=285 RepID=UPI001EE6819B